MKQAWKNPKLTADAVIIEKGRVVLVRRGIEPFKGMWALPGGFVEYGERTDYAAVREAFEETGLRVKVKKLVGVYSDPKRDPRWHSVAVGYLCKRVGPGEPRGGDDASEARWWPLGRLPKLAFDHSKIVKDAVKMLK